MICERPKKSDPEAAISKRIKEPVTCGDGSGQQREAEPTPPSKRLYQTNGASNEHRERQRMNRAAMSKACRIGNVRKSSLMPVVIFGRRGWRRSSESA